MHNYTSLGLRRCALRDASISLTGMLDDGRAMELSEKQAFGMETSGETSREAEVNITSERFKKKSTQNKRFNNTSKNTENRQKSTTCHILRKSVDQNTAIDCKQTLSQAQMQLVQHV